MIYLNQAILKVVWNSFYQYNKGKFLFAIELNWNRTCNTTKIYLVVLFKYSKIFYRRWLWKYWWT